MGDVEPGRANILESQRVTEPKARKDVVLVNHKIFGDVSLPYLYCLLWLNNVNAQSTKLYD